MCKVGRLVNSANEIDLAQDPILYRKPFNRVESQFARGSNQDEDEESGSSCSDQDD